MNRNAARSYFYYNLHQSCWSEMLRGKVVAHHQAVELFDVEFRVRQAGRKRVLREKRKNVHAFAIPNYFYHVPEGAQTLYQKTRGPWFEITYHPHTSGHFFCKDTGMPVSRAEAVVLTAYRKVFAQGLR